MALALGVTAEELGETMSGRELMEWTAFERVHGPVLVHDRIDVGFAMLARTIANLLGNRRFKIQHFLPPWLREAAEEASVRDAFASLFERARRDADH